MICNIIDRRTRPYRWIRINAIVEPTWHCNACPDGDQAGQASGETAYEAREGIPLADAIAWANNRSYPVTVYLYDEGRGTSPAPVASAEDSN